MLSYATDQCELFLSNVKAQLACYMEEATMLVRKLEEQEICVGDTGEITTIGMRDLKTFIELGENLQMDRIKLCSKRCNFYNRGFCKNRMKCFFAHPLRCAVTL